MEENISPKVMQLYEAVIRLIEEGTDINSVKVAEITDRAGIGKGTAYEYFNNKEEMISSAILYHISCTCRQFEKKIGELDCFSEIISYALNFMENELGESGCFIKYVHIFSDNGAVSRMLQCKMEKNKGKEHTPQDLLERILQIGIKNGEIRETAPKTYMIMTLAAKLLVYAVFLNTQGAQEDCSREEMHRLIYVSLLKEFNQEIPTEEQEKKERQ